MGETVKATDWPPPHEDREQEEITMPIELPLEIVPTQGGPRSARTHWVKKKGESAPRTPDWKDIGEPT
ncbi:MAG TPA: hypothetical protein VKH43_10475 [Thermoanaerobaculia bacterium]|nr:hypothetical protein [Thermoanaerobaculia bacterium]